MANLKRVDEVVASIKRRDQQMTEVSDTFVECEGQMLVSAKVLGEFLGYKDPSNFMACVNRAQIIAADTNQSVEQHFIIPSLYQDDDGMWLTPFAASLAIMEADARKPRVAAAKSYFAALADEKILEAENRLKERQVFKQYNIELQKAAELAGVKGRDHALFNHYGYLGMYNRGCAEVKKAKGIPAKKDLADCIGATELAANNLRMSMTRDALREGAAKTPKQANELHRQKGKIVRRAVQAGTGSLPEHLPAEPNTIDQLSSAVKRNLAQ